MPFSAGRRQLDFRHEQPHAAACRAADRVTQAGADTGRDIASRPLAPLLMPDAYILALIRARI